MSTEVTISEVPLLDLQAQYLQIEDEVKQAIDRVLESQYFIMGREVESFEQKVAEYCGVKNAVGCASGSDALLLSLMALDIGAGDAVITTPFTFFATAGAIARLGATPVFLDINPSSFNIAPEEVARFLGGNHPLNNKLDISVEEVKAIIPVHLYGQMAEMDPLMKLSQEYHIPVIGDAAQAIGSKYKGRPAGSIADFGCFSFFPSKNLGAYGDGGMVTTDDAEMAEKLRVLRLHGAKPKYHHSLIGINSRLDALQAAVLKVKLRYLDEWSDARREKALQYNRLFRKAGLAAVSESDLSPGDEKIPSYKIVLPVERQGAPERDGRHIYHQYVIKTSARQTIMDALDENNIGHAIYYPVPLHEQECFEDLGYAADDCPHASRASEMTLALPVYPEITDAQQAFVVATIKDAVKGK